MNSQSNFQLRTNHDITKRIIELHEKGFDMDFRFLGVGQVQCIQDNLDFDLRELSIMIIDQVYDQFTRSYKYIHSVESTLGHKGVLLCEAICASVQPSVTSIP